VIQRRTAGDKQKRTAEEPRSFLRLGRRSGALRSALPLVLLRPTA
jgi:hypothetical protein